MLMLNFQVQVLRKILLIQKDTSDISVCTRTFWLSTSKWDRNAESEKETATCWMWIINRNCYILPGNWIHMDFDRVEWKFNRNVVAINSHFGILCLFLSNIQRIYSINIYMCSDCSMIKRFSSNNMTKSYELNTRLSKEKRLKCDNRDSYRLLIWRITFLRTFSNDFNFF